MPLQTIPLCLLALFAQPPESAQTPREDEPASPPPFLDELTVEARADDLVGIAASAAEGVTGRNDLARRPLERPGSLVETTPGVVATQHSGGGKANQFFLRGFNLDHGTDFSVHVAGVPVNMPSHGHGQGYTDLNFLIPEMVARARFRKGPYDASVGDFSLAGSVDFDLVRGLPSTLLVLSGGRFDYGRAVWADTLELPAGGRLLGGVEVFHQDGPWDRGEDYDGAKGLLRYVRDSDRRALEATLMGYDADWLATDQVPARALESGRIGRFDLLDEGPRGATSRYSVSFSDRRRGARSVSELRGFLLRYDLRLVSNFTYFLDDAELGDQFEQRDDRWAGGASWQRSWSLDRSPRPGREGEPNPIQLTVGAELRHDDIITGLFRTAALQRVGAVRRDEIRQTHLGPFLQVENRWTDWLRSRAGLHVEHARVDVDSDLAANSDAEDDTIVSPKLSLIFGPWRSTELYLNAGWGFHSNDARGATIALDPTTLQPVAPVDLLVRGESYELGVRTAALAGLQSTVTLFQLELDSELVFVGDAGFTEASRPSRRRGLEWTNAYRIGRSLSLDLDLTLTDAEFTDTAPEGDQIPGAVGRTFAAGLSWERPVGLRAGLRWRAFGDVPLVENGSVEWSSSSLVDGRIGWRFRNGWSVLAELFNLLDAEESDIQYFYASRLPGEPPGGVEDVHLHPAPPRSLRLSLRYGLGGP